MLCIINNKVKGLSPIELLSSDIRKKEMKRALNIIKDNDNNITPSNLLQLYKEATKCLHNNGGNE